MNESSNLELLKFVLLALFTGSGAFLGSYLKRKGENLATHEDINQLVEQVGAVTTATKEIEAKISIDVWDKQKQWELKRDAVFEMTKRIATVRDALFNMNITHSFRGEQKQVFAEEQNKASQRCWDAQSSFDQATLLVNLVCGEEVKKLLDKFSGIMRRSAKQISKGDPAADDSLRELRVQADAITAAMRREIGIDRTLKE